MEIDRLHVLDFGKPAEVLALETGVAWSPAADAVVVEMHAAPLNPADLNLIEGTYGVRPELPFTPGIEGSGIVVSSPVADFAPGDRVVMLGRAGTWASHVSVPPDRLIKLPEAIDMRQAAMLKVNPATAWRLLHGFRGMERGEWVVQNAGNSGVGRCLIQLASSLGIRTISMVRNPELAGELEALGADHVLIDNADGLARALEILGGRKAVLACNAVGGESALRLMNLLADGATHVTYGAMARRPLTVPNGLLIFRDLAVRGLWVSRWIDSAPIDELRSVYANLARRVADGTLVQPVDSCFALAGFAEAMGRQMEPDRKGKVMFAMAE
ncbi:MAG: MDR family NADPH-dependent oxidoreductase [Luteolibacter sp.]|jgi:mitochondrial enoyl-[acyl-carrier protein] reductase / trans-2-enoyl-CoA reductase